MHLGLGLGLGRKRRAAVGGGGGSPPPAPVLWTPANLAVPPITWYDFSLLTGSDGDKVGTLTDKSGHGNDAPRVVNNNARAALNVAGLNGLNVLDFATATSPSGGKGYAPPNFMSGKTAGSLFAVLKSVNDGGGANANGLIGIFGVASDFWPWSTSALIGFGSSGSWWANYNPTPDLSVFHILGLTAKSNDGKLSYNDAQDATTSSLTIGWTSTPVIGYDSNSGSIFNNKMAELVFLDYVPTTIERNEIAGYLAWKWGLTAGLAGGHPYKTAAPTV